MHIKALIKNLNVLNMILLSITGLFTLYIFLPTLEPQVKFKLPSIKSPLEREGEESRPETRTPPMAEYAIVSERNLFNPERIIPVEKKDQQQQQQILSKPDFLLYGTLISNDTKLAYVEDLKSLRNTPGRGRRQIALKIGDSLSGFVVKEIHPDYIVMARGEETIVLKILENEDKKERNVQTTPKAAEQPASPPVRKTRNPRPNRVNR